MNGRYLVEVRLFNYSNPTGRCQECPLDNGGFCDGSRMPTRSTCDSFFIYCLRPLNTSEIEEGCSGFESMTSEPNRNDEPVDFHNATVLGLPNPLLLPGLTNAYMVSE